MSSQPRKHAAASACAALLVPRETGERRASGRDSRKVTASERWCAGLLLEDRSNKSSHAAHAANRHMQTSSPWPRRGRPGVCGVGDLIPHHLSTPMVTHCFFLSSLPAFPPLFHRLPPLDNFIPSPPSVLLALLGTRPARQPDEPLARDTVDL